MRGRVIFTVHLPTQGRRIPKVITFPHGSEAKMHSEINKKVREASSIKFQVELLFYLLKSTSMTWLWAFDQSSVSKWLVISSSDVIVLTRQSR